MKDYEGPAPVYESSDSNWLRSLASWIEAERPTRLSDGRFEGLYPWTPARLREIAKKLEIPVRLEPAEKPRYHQLHPLGSWDPLLTGYARTLLGTDAATVYKHRAAGDIAGDVIHVELKLACDRTLSDDEKLVAKMTTPDVWRKLVHQACGKLIEFMRGQKELEPETYLEHRPLPDLRCPQPSPSGYRCSRCQGHPGLHDNATRRW